MFFCRSLAFDFAGKKHKYEFACIFVSLGIMSVCFYREVVPVASTFVSLLTSGLGFKIVVSCKKKTVLRTLRDFSFKNL